MPRTIRRPAPAQLRRLNSNPGWTAYSAGAWSYQPWLSAAWSEALVTGHDDASADA
jgi:hypothetical protein